MIKIAIIGAGLSGRLLALNLVRQGTSAVSIRMIDRGDTRYMGPAYSYETDYLLLNVRAGQMGAFSEDPEHFLMWAQERGARAGRSDFLPRRLFRDYILDLMADAWQTRTNSPLFEHVCGEVTDIETEGGCATIHVEAQEPFVVDREFSHWATSRRVIRSLKTGWLFRAGGTCGIRGPKGCSLPSRTAIT